MRKIEFEKSLLPREFVESHRVPPRRGDPFASVDQRVAIDRMPVHSVSITVVDGITFDFRMAIVEPVYADPTSPIKVMLSDVALQARDLERRHSESLLARVVSTERGVRSLEDQLYNARKRHAQEERGRIEREDARAYRDSWAERYLQGDL